MFHTLTDIDNNVIMVYLFRSKRIYMAAANYNFSLEQGIPLSKTIFLKNSDNSIKDLTSFTAKMQLRQYAGHPDVLLELSTDNSKININVGTGAVTMIFSSIDSSSISFSEVVYDLVLYNGSLTFAALEGKISIRQAVTV